MHWPLNRFVLIAGEQLAAQVLDTSLGEAAENIIVQAKNFTNNNRMASESSGSN